MPAGGSQFFVFFGVIGGYIGFIIKGRKGFRVQGFGLLKSRAVLITRIVVFWGLCWGPPI